MINMCIYINIKIYIIYIYIYYICIYINILYIYILFIYMGIYEIMIIFDNRYNHSSSCNTRFHTSNDLLIVDAEFIHDSSGKATPRAVAGP